MILLGFELLGEAGPRSTQKHTTHLFVTFRDILPHKKSCPEKLEKQIWSTNSNVNVEMLNVEKGSQVNSLLERKIIILK